MLAPLPGPLVLTPVYWLSAVVLAVAAGQVAAAELPLARFVAPEAEAKELEPVFELVLARTRLPATPDPEDDERLLRRLRDRALEVLQTEGYFTAQITAEPDREQRARYVLRVSPGPRAQIADVDLKLTGGIEAQPRRIAELVKSWELNKGQPFRDREWSTAKTRLLARVQERDFPAARLVDSEADVDVDAARVNLRVEIDSGPPFTIGELEVTGLERYDQELVERFNPFKAGDRYDAAQLLEFQRRLQTSPYFGRVVVDVEIDPERPQQVPLKVELTEAKTKRVSFGAGYSTNTGPRVEATYRQTLLFGAPYTLQTGLGIDKTRSVGFADILLPPKPNGAIDSFGVLAERTDIEGQHTKRWAAGVARARSFETKSAAYDTKLSLTLQRELRRAIEQLPPPAEQVAPITNDVLSLIYTWTRRTVDQITDPRRGDILTLRAGPGLQRSGISDTFFFTYGRYVRYFELSPKDQVIVRGEIGHNTADDLNRVPNEFLFRAGGAGSVRGYRYQSLGVREGAVTRGSRSLAVGSLEYVRWFSEAWGGALFYDVGDADDDLWRITWAKGYGVGARWRTIAGPLALDAAYSDRDHRWRLHFSIAVAF
ncbi:MAG TPA: BamA/TamA family outer membrane protein [Burkholderiaceae bacterium]|nr:BamA/TamA family outer membrane protein [Burkholderiaceae bacterium]